MVIALMLVGLLIQATPSGVVRDPSGLPVAGATVRLSAVQGEVVFETRSDSDGRFTFLPMPPGDYFVSARYPGFLALRERITVGPSPSPMSLTILVGTLQETITVRGGGNAADGTRTVAARPRPGDPPCTPQRIGGRIIPPMKIRDVRPRYLRAFAEAGLKGHILLQARIGVDGRVQEVEVVSPVHPDLEEEALAAVSQWEFTTTWLNCQPVEVRMFVTVSFSDEP